MASKDQTVLAINFFIKSPDMKKAVWKVLFEGYTVYKAGKEHGIARSALGRQVRLMDERMAFIDRCTDARDTDGEF